MARNERSVKASVIATPNPAPAGARTDQLIYELTVTDPATLTGPVTMRAVYDWHLDLVVEPYQCTLGE